MLKNFGRWALDMILSLIVAILYWPIQLGVFITLFVVYKFKLYKPWYYRYPEDTHNKPENQEKS